MKNVIQFLGCLVLSIILCSSCCHTEHAKHNAADSYEDTSVVAVLLSDFHIGEIHGAVSRTPYQNNVRLASDMYCHPRVINFIEQVDSIVEHSNKGKRIKHLILLGDIIDLAVHEESDAFNLAKAFFSAEIYKGHSLLSYFDEVIYVQGNHDHHVWHMLQEKYYVTDRLQQDHAALPFPQQVYGVLNLDNSELKLSESLLNEHATKRNDFINRVFANKKVHYVYPNLYIQTPNQEDICVTHGHFLEPNWNKTDAVVPHFTSIKGDTLNYFRNLEKLNAPFTEFSDYALAQADERDVQNLTDGNIYNKEGKNITGQVADTLAANYPAFFPLDTGPRLSDSTKLNANAGIVNAYLQHTKAQMANNTLAALDFKRLLYGHTHIPAMHLSYAYSATDSIIAYNTGGWVNIENKVDNNDTIKAPNPLKLLKNGSIASIMPYGK